MNKQILTKMFYCLNNLDMIMWILQWQPLTICLCSAISLIYFQIFLCYLFWNKGNYVYVPRVIKRWPPPLIFAFVYWLLNTHKTEHKETFLSWGKFHKKHRKRRITWCPVHKFPSDVSIWWNWGNTWFLLIDDIAYYISSR